MKSKNSSIEINLNSKVSNVDYWDYYKVYDELGKFINQREAFYKKNGFFYHKYFVSIEPTTFAEKDLRKPSEKMQTLTDKFNNLQDVEVIDMFKNFFDLFQREPAVYTLLSDLVDIYNADLQAYKDGYRVKIENDAKMKLLKRSFEIFSHLLYRDEILETIIKDKREGLPEMLLNEDGLLYRLANNYSELLITGNIKRLAMADIFRQLKDNQR